MSAFSKTARSYELNDLAEIKFPESGADISFRLLQDVVVTKRADVIPLLQRFLMFKDRGALEDAYDYFVERFQQSPRPCPALNLPPLRQKNLQQVVEKAPAQRSRFDALMVAHDQPLLFRLF